MPSASAASSFKPDAGLEMPLCVTELISRRFPAPETVAEPATGRLRVSQARGTSRSVNECGEKVISM
jgi:hypothetical protein